MRYVLDTTIVIVLAALAIFFMRNQFNPSPYYYDEADYLYAASRGFAANWTDTPAFTPWDFIRVGLGRGRDPSKRSDLSEWIRESGDINSYRHWHGPFYYYCLIAANAPGRVEREVRKLALPFVVFGIALIYSGMRWISGGGSRLPALVAAGLFALNPPVLTSTEVAPHVLFTLLCLASLFCAAKLLISGARPYWFAALALAGGAFCTSELTFALVFALLVCAWLERSRLRLDGDFAFKSVAAFLAPVVLLWPAGLYKLTFVKSYLAMAYLAVFRKGAWGNMTLGEAWFYRVIYSPVTWALVIAALLVYAARPQLPGRRALLAFLVFGFVMLAAVFRVNDPLPRYTLLYLSPLLVFAGGILGNWTATLSRAKQSAMIAAVFGLLLWDVWKHTRHTPIPADQRMIDVLAAVRQDGLQDKSLLVQQYDVPMLHYYFPNTRLRGYVDPQTIPQQLAARHFDAIVYAGSPPRIQRLSSRPGSGPLE